MGIALRVRTALDHEHHRAAWKNIDYPSWMLRATRWQVLTPIDGRTRYETREVFAGLLAYVVYWFFGGKLKAAFETMARVLRERSERLAAR